MTTIHFLTKVANIHDELATIVYPHGVILACRECDYNRIATEADCAHYFAHGWPQHCGREMVVTEVKSHEAE